VALILITASEFFTLRSLALNKCVSSTVSYISEAETARIDDIESGKFHSTTSRSISFDPVASWKTQPDDHQVPDSMCMHGPATTLPALTEPVPAHWTIVEGCYRY
jgi:hypothetical protein